MLIAGVGLTGKVLGPIGLAVLILRGDWPLETMVLSLTNDLVWWGPFALYLHDVWSEATERTIDRRAGS